MIQIVDEGSTKRYQKSRFQIYSTPLPLNYKISLTSYIAGFLTWSSLVSSLFPNIIPSNVYLSNPVRGEYDLSSNSVLIRTDDEDEKKILWERGFFGKGNLSRSEPTWANRMKLENEHHQSGGDKRGKL